MMNLFLLRAIRDLDMLIVCTNFAVISRLFLCLAVYVIVMFKKKKTFQSHIFDKKYLATKAR